MKIGVFIFDNLHIITILSTPLVIFCVIKFRQYKPKRNNLTSRYVKYKRQEEALNLRIKGGSLFTRR